MKARKIAWAISFLFASGSAFAAPVAKVLALAGDAYVTRSGQETRLALGAPLENGDSLRVGDASVLQVRFIDESIISLRANSVFKIEDFAFSRNPQTDRSFFALVRGGLRTITGLIGRENRANYAVKGATATIGIRGTYYTVVSCTVDAACLNPDGSAAPEGLYGGVTDGRIAVINDLGEFQFGQQEYFRLTGRNVQPERLLAPPVFLGTGFEAAARGRSRGTGPGAAVAAGREGGGSSPQTSNSPQTASLAPLADALPANIQSFVPADTPAVIGGGAQSPIVAGDGKAPTATGELTAVLSKANPSNPGEHVAETAGFSAIQWSTAGLQRATNSASDYIDRGSARTYERGADGGIIEWGRWAGGPVSIGGWGDNLNYSATQGMHYLIGSQTDNIPTNGVGIAYALLGATSPTFSDGSGNGLGLGRVTGGSAKVNFNARTLNGGFDLAFASGNTYRLILDGSFSGAEISGSGRMTQTAGGINVCGANGCGGYVSGFFAGNAAAYMGLGYDIMTETATPLSLNGVLALNRTGALPTVAYANGNFSHSYSAAIVGVKGGSTPIGAIWGAYQAQDTFTNFPLPAGLSSYNGVLDFLMNAAGPFPDLGQAGVTKIKDASVDTGSVGTSEGTINWGRYREVVTNSALPAENAINFRHWAVGPVVTSLPTSGAFTFSHLGGTLPTDQNGNVGSLVSGGSWSVSFLNRTLQSATPLTWSMPNGVTYTLNVSTPINWTTGTLPTRVETAANGGTMTSTETRVNPFSGNFTVCAGNCTMNTTWLSPQFHGATGTGLSLGIQTSATINGSEQLTGQVRVYGNPTPAALPTTYLFSDNQGSALATTTYVYPGPSITSVSNSSPRGNINSLVSVSPDAVFPAGQPATALGAFTDGYTFTDSQTVGGNTTNRTVTKSPSTDNGSASTSEGAYSWGRYTRQESTSTSGPCCMMGPNTSNTTEYTHWSYGPAVTSLPTTGTFVFSSIGGTQPTDQAGNVGSVSSPGSWSVNFLNRTLISASPMMWSMPNGVSYELHVNSPVSWSPSAPATQTTPLPTGSMTTVSTSVSSVSATPYLTCFPTCSVIDARLSPQFGGANATGLSLGITTNANTNSGQQATSQIRIYKR